MTASTGIPPAALIGQVMNGYHIDSYIAGGGFGMVFEATNQSTGSRFAVKVLIPNSDPSAAIEFDVEGRLLQKLLKCTGVITCIESGTAVIPLSLGGTGTVIHLPFKYHVMALATASLEDLVDDPVRRAALPWPERLAHWRGAILGVHQMHLNKVAHRDLKSGNCLILLHKGDTEVRIGDLGRSKDSSLPASLPATAYVVGRGDARFAAPEHLYCQGGCTELDFRLADLYGLGSLFVELVTGHPMTALAIGSWQTARAQGQHDLSKGLVRDLANLRPQYRQAIEQLAADIPAAIRLDATKLVSLLCDPVPAARRPPRVQRKKPAPPDNGLLWLLRHAEILSRRLSVENRRQPHKKTRSRSA